MAFIVSSLFYHFSLPITYTSIAFRKTLMSFKHKHKHASIVLIASQIKLNAIASIALGSPSFDKFALLFFTIRSLVRSFSLHISFVVDVLLLLLCVCAHIKKATTNRNRHQNQTEAHQDCEQLDEMRAQIHFLNWVLRYQQKQQMILCRLLRTQRKTPREREKERANKHFYHAFTYSCVRYYVDSVYRHNKNRKFTQCQQKQQSRR